MFHYLGITITGFIFYNFSFLMNIDMGQNKFNTNDYFCYSVLFEMY